jgi:predicted DNA-binding transcriptional regulator YafY
MKRLDRLVAIALFLGSRRRVLARDIAARFDVSLRTVYRDVRALAGAGFPVEGNAGDGYRLSQDAFLRPLALTTEEAEVLVVAARGLEPAMRPPLSLALARATAKLEAALDRPTQRRLAELDRRIVVSPSGHRGSAPTQEILVALRDHRVASIDYDDHLSGRRTTRAIEPLGLVCLGEIWWLVAYCRLRAGARAFRVDRITAWRAATEIYEPRPGFSFSEVIARDRHLAAQLFGC